MSLLPYLYNVQRPLRAERDLFRPEEMIPFHRMVPRELFNPNQFFNPQQLVSPAQFLKPWENILGPMEQLANVLNQLAVTEGTKISSDNEKFQVNIDVQHFAPDEIDVKVVDHFVVVAAKHEERMDEHGYVSRQFVRRYALPQGCLPDTVESKLSSDGVLTVTAPKVLALPSSGERIVPITHTGPVKKQIGSSEPTNTE